MLVPLRTLASDHSHGTKDTSKDAAYLLNYAATHHGAIIYYHKRNMVLHIYSDVLYLSEPKDCSRSRVLHFLISRSEYLLPNNLLNGAIHVFSNIMHNILVSATKAKVGALSQNN